MGIWYILLNQPLYYSQKDITYIDIYIYATSFLQAMWRDVQTHQARAGMTVVGDCLSTCHTPSLQTKSSWLHSFNTPLEPPATRMCFFCLPTSDFKFESWSARLPAVLREPIIVRCRLLTDKYSKPARLGMVGFVHFRCLSAIMIFRSGPFFSP